MDGALAAFSTASEKEPDLGEAHADAAFMWEQGGQLNKAIEEYQRAVESAPGSAVYRTSLADEYFQRAYGAYDKTLQEEGYAKALKEYDQAGNYPLAAIEAAAIYRLQNRLPEAEERELEAIQWLQEGGVRNADDIGWAQSAGPAPADKLRMRTTAEKKCYAELELAVTHYLQGHDQNAAEAVSKIFAIKECDDRKSDLSNILKWELYQLGIATPQLSSRADDFTKKFLDGPYAERNNKTTTYIGNPEFRAERARYANEKMELRGFPRAVTTTRDLCQHSPTPRVRTPFVRTYERGVRVRDLDRVRDLTNPMPGMRTAFPCKMRTSTLQNRSARQNAVVKSI